MESRNIAYIPPLTHLRAYAALLVVFTHSIPKIWQQIHYQSPLLLENMKSQRLIVHNPIEALLVEGHTGVGFFMVISGFILTMVAYGKNLAYFRYITNRLLRTYPLYLLLLFTGVYSFAGKIDFLSFLQMVVCFANIQSIQQIFELWVGFAMFWAISVEWQFYILFPFLMRILNRHKCFYLVGIIAAFIIMRGFAFFEGANPTYISYWTILGRMDQFLIGMILAVIHARTVSEKRSTISMSCALIFSSILILLSLFWFHTQGGVFKVTWWRLFWPTVEGGLWAFFIIGYIRLFPNPSGLYHKMMSGIGKMSYSIYLLHWLVIRFFVEHASISEIVTDHGLSAIIYTIIVIIPVTLILSMVTYTFIEKPFMDMRLRYTIEDKKSPASTRRVSSDDT